MNIHQQFSILFWVKNTKINKQGLVPIWVRITIDGARTECSTHRHILPEHWDSEKRCVRKACTEAGQINDYLAVMKATLIKHFSVLSFTKDYVTPEEVMNNFKGVKAPKKSFLELFRLYNQKLLERKEIDDLSEGRYERFLILQSKCESFVKHKFQRQDVSLDELKLNFIVEFEHYLRTVQKIGHNTAMKYAKDLKQVMKYGVMLEYMTTSPFEHFKCSFHKVKRQFLDQEELDLLYAKEFSIQRLAEVRDCYLFSCYTGYAYADAEDLNLDDLAIGIDGEKWIIRQRIKMDNPENVPLLPIPLEIIEKYRDHPYCKANRKLLPMNSNQRYNAYLKEVADLCGITKKLTTHTARHTFATTVLLCNDVPMETAMELLGHTDIRTTQIYGKIVQKKLSNDMQKLKAKLSLTNPLVIQSNT